MKYSIILILSTLIIGCSTDDKVPNIEVNDTNNKSKNSKLVSGKEKIKFDNSNPEMNTGNESFENSQINIKGNPTLDTPDNDYLVGKTSFSNDRGFVLVNPKHCSKSMYLRTQVYEAFIKMYNTAIQEGIQLIIISGARSFEHQKSIWERKWNNLNSTSPKEKALEILKYSSMPMSSRHHWGTDFDLNSLENEYFESKEGLKIYNWLTANASKFGFCQVYSDKKVSDRKGYEMEKWHWSFMPLSSKLLERYNRKISIGDINGFQGSEVASEIGIIENYVNGINNCH
ncbi:M15 family metallopeptidase [Crocinitomicaceae bacterium]|nr:M15 family metallopeptidase [Crocinitomicaceae bacterium]